MEASLAHTPLWKNIFAGYRTHNVQHFKNMILLPSPSFVYFDTSMRLQTQVHLQQNLWACAPREWHKSGFLKRFYLFIFRERGREGEREGEKHPCVVASRTPPTRDAARGMCPDWESTWRPFGSQTSAQTTKPHQPGLKVFLIALKSGTNPQRTLVLSNRRMPMKTVILG